MQTHPLAEWIGDRMSQADFARLAQISASHLSLVLQGKRGLSLKQAVRIEQATNGEVLAAALVREQQGEVA